MTRIDPNERLASAADGIESARKWERKGDYMWAQRVYSSSTMQHFSIVLGECSSMAEAKQWMVELGMLDILRKTCEIEEILLRLLEQGKAEGHDINSYMTVTFSHVSCLLGDFSLGGRYLKTSQADVVCSCSTVFWQEYIKAYGKLWSGQAYQRSTQKGMVRDWVPYLDLMEAASQGLPLEPKLVAIDAEFATWNSDKRRRDDSFQIEGSPYYPVRWNWRKDALLAVIGQR